jgi:hypothetical protein
VLLRRVDVVVTRCSEKKKADPPRRRVACGENAMGRCHTTATPVFMNRHPMGDSRVVVPVAVSNSSRHASLATNGAAAACRVHGFLGVWGI